MNQKAKIKVLLSNYLGVYFKNIVNILTILNTYIIGHVEILNAVNRYGSRVRRFSIKDNLVALKNVVKSLKAWKDGGRYRVDIAE